MANKIFLDTNILIDYISERNFELEATKEIFRLGETGKLDLYISESIIATTFYVLQKEKINALAILRAICKVVHIAPFAKDILYHPLEKYKDAEDGLLYFLASKAKMNYFITRNVKAFTFTFPSLPVMNPTKFLKEISFHDLSQ